MADQVDICNMALLLIGADTIVDIDDPGSAEAQVCKAAWQPILEATLRAHPWNCATAQVSLAPLSAAPLYGYSYAFQLPGDCLRVIDADQTGDRWQVVGRTLVCDINPVNITYIARVSDYSTLDAMLVDALAAHLAMKICYKLTASRAMRGEMYKLYANLLQIAQVRDSQEGFAELVDSTTFLDAR